MSTLTHRSIPDYRPVVDMNSSTVKRCLFGEPDHDYVRAELLRQLDSMAQKDSQKYNFDFVREMPLEGDYKWETVLPAAVLTKQPPSITLSRSVSASPKQKMPATQIKRSSKSLKFGKPAVVESQTRLTG